VLVSLWKRVGNFLWIQESVQKSLGNELVFRYLSTRKNELKQVFNWKVAI
jgi:hypothetical protein